MKTIKLRSIKFTCKCNIQWRHKNPLLPRATAKKKSSEKADGNELVDSDKRKCRERKGERPTDRMPSPAAGFSLLIQFHTTATIYDGTVTNGT